MPGNGLLSIPAATPEIDKPYSGFRISLEPAYDFVSDTTDYEGPVANGETVDSVKIKRYEGSHLIGDLMVNDHLLIHAGQWERNLANKRDTFSLHTRQAAIQYRFPWNWLGNSYAIRLGWWSNSASALTKSSYTRLNNFKITSLLIEQPDDNQHQINFMMARELNANSQLSAFLGIGQSHVDYKRIHGEFTDKKDCQYNFELEKTSGRVDQQGKCGNILSNTTIMPNELSITNNLGLNPRDDLQYSSLFFQLGGGVTWKSHHWEGRLGYYFQRFDRQGLDERIDQSGNDSFRDNHSVSTDVAWRLNRSVSLFWRGEYVTSRLLTMVPLSYNPYTAERFSRDGVFFTVGLRISM